MIIDFHTHTFPDKIAKIAIEKLKSASHTRAFTGGTEGELLSSMASCTINTSVVLPVATNPDKIPHINDISADKNRDGRLIYLRQCTLILKMQKKNCAELKIWE